MGVTGPSAATVFQSLVGRLQTLGRVGVRVTSESSFQSLVGRLQTVRPRVARGQGVMFQSLVGRLQTPAADGRRESPVPCFNPS